MLIEIVSFQLFQTSIVDGDPVLIYTIATQELHMVSNKKGDIVEGGPVGFFFSHFFSCCCLFMKNDDNKVTLSHTNKTHLTRTT